VDAGRKRLHVGWGRAISGIAPALRGGAMWIGGIAPALRGGAMSIVLCSALVAAQVRAQPATTSGTSANEDEQKAQAKQRFEQAVTDYDAERYEQALANFQEAYRLRPHPLVNVNIANCYDKLNKPLQAIFHFERFLESEAGAPAQRHEVAAALERLRKRVGQLLLRISPDGATVMIDQGDQRRTPILEPIPLEAGHHMIQVRLPGYRTLQRNVTVDGGSTFELSLSLEPERGNSPVLSVTPSASDTSAAPSGEVPPSAPQAAPSESAADPADASEAGPSAGVWVAGALTGVLAVTGVITGVLALRASSDFDQKKTRYEQALAQPATTPLVRVDLYNAARDDADRADALSLTTDLLLSGALIGAAVTTYLLLVDSSDEEQPSAQIAPAVSADGGGARLAATF
jgi:hypothetical protein